MIIDATNIIVGRMASFVAKKALLGEDINIVNCEKAMMTGNKKEILQRYKEKRKIKAPRKGPYMYRMPDRFVKRIIRGMLPYKKEKGKRAYKNIKCYIGIPEKFANQKFETVPKANITKVPNLRYIAVQEICKSIGGNI